MGTDWFRTEFVNGSVNKEERLSHRPGGIPRTNLRVISTKFAGVYKMSSGVTNNKYRRNYGLKSS
jgi:hypothetical protein